MVPRAFDEHGHRHPGGLRRRPGPPAPTGPLAWTGALVSTHYLRLLLWLLIPAALFNAYDAELRAVLLTQLKDTFHVGTAAIGVANIPIASGQFVAFFVVLAADRIGRRPILMWTILGYTVCTTLTAAAWNLWTFAVFQSGAQVFIGAEFGVAVTLLAEEVPSESRGRYLSWLLLVSPLGAVLAGCLVAVGFLHNPIGWRAFFLLACLPLLVVAVARRRLHESHAYLELAAASRPHRSRGEVVLEMFRVWGDRARRYVVAVGLIAFFQGLASAAAVGWWTNYAETDRHFSTGMAGSFYAGAALVSVGGYIACGRMMDRVGRRPTAIVYVLAAVACGVVTFQVSNHWVMLPFLIGTSFFGIGVAPVLSAFATELFPTSVRAQASAWIRNAFGNTGSLLGPTLAGVLGATSLFHKSVGNAVTVLMVPFLVVVPLVLLVLPETRRIALDRPDAGTEPDSETRPAKTGPAKTGIADTSTAKRSTQQTGPGASTVGWTGHPASPRDRRK